MRFEIQETVHSLINALLRYDNVKFVLISPNELKVPEYIIEKYTEGWSGI